MKPIISIAAFALAVGIAQAQTAPPAAPAAKQAKAEVVVPGKAADAKPLTIGTKAPSGKLQTMDGKTVKLKELTAGKPTVLIFYRGDWCPFCNKHLAELEGIQSELTAKGFQILAVSPDLPEDLKKMADKNKLTYQILSDSKAGLMKKFGVAFRLDDETYNKYQGFGVNLEKNSGQTHHILPVPSVFIIDRAGTIQFAYSNPDYKVRLSASDVMKAVNGMK